MIDTNVFVNLVCEQDRLSRDVLSILDDCENQILMSMESVRELIVHYRTKKLLPRHWKSAREMIISVEKDYQIKVVPVDMRVMKTMSDLQVNEEEDHRDPSDHVIISHAMTLRIPLISSDKKFPFYRSQGLTLIDY